jgi:DNA helicase-2/ATP-dependent DNA helicase PcrA
MPHPTRPDGDLLAGLNPAQRDAVTTVDGPLLVVAGAGSGKTRVLTHRIAHLIRDHGVSPFEILAITFTNKAAGEMVERVGQLVGANLADKMWVTTFHKACVRILRRELGRLGYRSGFTIYDSQDSQRLVATILKDQGVDDKRVTPRSVQHAISRAKDELVDFETYKARADTYPETVVADVYETYQQRLLRANALDFDDLIVKTVEVLQLFPAVLEHYQQRFRYLMVDEYQDTNRAQYHLVNLLAAGHRNVMVVGDHDQCLPPGTLVSTPGGTTPIEKVRPGDVVLSTGGGSVPTPADVRDVFAGHYTGDLYELAGDGFSAQMTPYHLLPTRVPDDLPGEFVYLMYREDRGYRLGRTKASRPRGGSPAPGRLMPANQEGAQAIWLLRHCTEVADASYWEAYYSIAYSLPTTCFHAKGRSFAMDDARIPRLYDELDTEDGGKALMRDLELHPDFPHHRPNHRQVRAAVSLTMFHDPRHGGRHRVAWSSVRDDLHRRLVSAGFAPSRDGRGGWRLEFDRSDYSEALALAEEMADAADLAIVHRFRVGQQRYELLPASQVLEGMHVLVQRPDGSFVDRSVIARRRRFYDGPILDLEVEDRHNFVADGLVVRNSIYRFRGATIANLVDFEADYPDATVIPLVQNYRSTQNILDAANAVIRHNRTRKPKELWTEAGAGPHVVRYHASDEHDEAAFVSEEVERLRRDGARFDQVAVFYRTNAQSRVLEDVFLRVGTPYQIIGGLRFYERREIKDLLAYARLLVNPDDDVSAKRVLNVPRRGIGRKTEEALDWHARREGLAFLEACRQAGDVQGLGPRAVAAVDSFVQLLDLLRTLAEEGMAVPELIEELWSRTGYMKELQAERTIEALGREENLRELKSVAQELHARDPDGGLDAFLESVTLVSEQDALADPEDDDEGQVTLMTLHNAKGLEYPVVFVVGLEDGVFPHVRSLSQPDELEEERRLCYVGLTRAQERLYVTHADHRTLWGGTSFNPPSRFLRELPEELVEARAASRTGSAAARVRDREVLAFEGEEWRVGDQVIHTKFGPGLIVSLSGEGEQSEALVDFTSVGRKQLLLAYAPLVRAS